MKKMNILIIARTILPSQYPRSFRATELAKGLAQKGHNVTLYAVLGEFDYSSFEKEYNIKVKNVGKMWFATLNSDEKGRRTLLDKIFQRLLSRVIEFPNIEFLFKVPKIIKKEKGIDYLITIANPHPIHWGAALAKRIYSKTFPRFWVADCGDPYMGNKVQKSRPLFYFKYFEKFFCNNVDYITIPIEGARKGYYSDFHEKIEIIPQGFSFDDIYSTIKPDNIVPTFGYSGIFYPGFRDPTLFLSFLTKLDKPFKFIVYTRENSLLEPFQEKLKDKLEIRSYIPRVELLKELSSLDFLVNFENGTAIQSPSKLIDYAITNRPILAVDSNKLQEKKIIQFLKGDYSGKYLVEDIEQYDIRNVSTKFINLLKKK